MTLEEVAAELRDLSRVDFLDAKKIKAECARLATAIRQSNRLPGDMSRYLIDGLTVAKNNNWMHPASAQLALLGMLFEVRRAIESENGDAKC